MKILSTLLTAAVALLLGFTPTVAAASVSIEVTPFLAPSTGSSAYFGHAVNTLNGLRSFNNGVGMPGTPSFSSSTSSVGARQLVSTSGFNAWNGLAGPTGDFAGEFGNSVRFGVRAIGQNGTQVSLSQLGFSTLSNDPGNPFTSSVIGSLMTYDFTRAVGVLAGSNGTLGDFDDILIASGPSTTLVDMLVFLSPGLSLPATCPGCTLSQQQAAIDTAAGLFQGTSIGGAATLGAFSGQGQLNVTPFTAAIPEPATWAMLITGFGLVGTTLRRRRAAMA